MMADVEYRTTERIDNKAIYKKKISSGEILYRLDGETEWRHQNDLVGAAPAGYGLGRQTWLTEITTLAQMDGTANCGWY